MTIRFIFLKVGLVLGLFLNYGLLSADNSESVDCALKEMNNAYTWSEIQKKSKDSVVQVFNLSKSLDWLKPFSSSQYGEGR